MKITPASLFQDIHSWQDFEALLQTFSKKEKGDAFEWLVKFYFQIDPILQSKYTHVWLLREIPASEREYINIHAEDLGIDLIAKTEDEYHAIQCKFHSDKTKAVTYKEVSTYLAQLESNPKITQGFICAFADGTSRQYQKHNAKPVNQILSDTWSQLEKDFFDNVRHLIEGKKPRYSLFEPKDHQRKAIVQAKEYFLDQDQRRGKLIFPCGAGKSLTGFWMMQALQARSALIAVPSLSLVKQTLDIYLKQITAQQGHVNWLCICSDEGIGKNEDVVYFTENLGIPCNTKPIEIEQWLLKHKNEPIIVFTTYQSSPIIASITQKINYCFDVAILDEAHKTVGHKEKLFSHLLFDENIRIQRRIFMTATERFFSGPKDEILSMDDPEVYGDTFAFMSFKEAIRLELLTDYRLITIDVKKSEIASFIRENNLVQLNEKWKKEAESRSLASMLALRKAMTQLPIKNAVSFHGSIEKARRSKELQEYITTTYQYDPIQTYTVSGLIPTTQRNEIVQEFARSPRSLITNAKCLTEGVDVPNIDCIVFSDPRSSKVDIVQALGRALRKKEGKEWGYVIVPVIYDDETGEIDNESFGEIMNIVQGLASNDERIVEYFRDKNKQEGQAIGGGEEKFHLDIISDYLDAEELAHHLEIRLWEKLARLHWMEFEEAREYVRGLKLQNQFEWRQYVNSSRKLRDIPNNPDFVYKNNGWTSWGDWLGSGYISTNLREYLTFNEAREIVINLQLKGRADWRDICENGNLPKNIPKSPDKYYKENGWIDWGNWFGTNRKANYLVKYKKFSDARAFARNLGLKSTAEWSVYCKSGQKPLDIPNTPDHVYKDLGWVNYGDWLGTYKTATQFRNYLDFYEARAFVRDLKLKDEKEWLSYCKSGLKPQTIPQTPRQIYKNDGWVSIGDWLGTYVVAANKWNYKTYELAKEFIRNLNFQSIKDWKNYCKSGQKPDDIPSNPPQTYKNRGWVSWGDWLGTNKIANQKLFFKKFSDGRTFARSLNLKSNADWKKYSKSGLKPDDIPSNPPQTYKNNGWISWGDWLGTEYVANQFRKYIEFDKAIKIAQSLKLKTRKEWIIAYKEGKITKTIPMAVDRFYKSSGWVSWSHWLGSDYIPTRFRTYLDFQSARESVWALKLTGRIDWNNYCKSGKKPTNIPHSPHIVYKNNGWISWGDWFGNGNIHNKNKIYKEFNVARSFIRKQGITGKNNWSIYCKSNLKPIDIPADPSKYYKGKGWISWGDWLGSDNKNAKNKGWLDFDDARKFAHSLALKSKNEWAAYSKSSMKPDNIPSDPSHYYKDKGWISWGNWLGKE